jgi:3-oxoacyl-[acyl-carrier-protein] synthase II
MAGEKRVAITGLGAVSSVGMSAEETYCSMLNGDRGISNQRAWMEESFPEPYRRLFRTHLFGRIPDFDLLEDPAFAASEEFNERYLERYASRTALLVLKASAEALRQAGITTPMLELTGVASERFAFVVGSGAGGAVEMASFQTMMEVGKKGVPATAMSKSQPENAAILASMFYKSKGPNAAPPAACASSNIAFADAIRKIKLGEADVIVAGGTEAYSHMTVGMFERTGAGSDAENPDLASRPFHENPGQAVLSEGAGLMVLEDEDHARARGALILGYLDGYSVTADAADPTLMDGIGITRSMLESMDMAEVGPDEKIHPGVHATATSQGDDGEAGAIHTVFDKSKKYSLQQIENRVVAHKRFTGHPVGGANAIAAVVAVQSMNSGKLPRSDWGGETREDMLGLMANGNPEETDVFLINGMGFGGQNGSIVGRKN